MPHLNGVINEVLRLHPAVPTGGFRETPPEGVEIGGQKVPGNTLICAPRWTIGRRRKSSKHFSVLADVYSRVLLRGTVELCARTLVQ